MGDAKLLYGYGVWWVSFLLSSLHLLTCRTTTCGGDHRFLWGEIVVTLSVLNHTNTYKYNIPPKKKTCIQCVEFHRRSWSGSVVGNTKEIAERFHTSPPQFARKMRCNVLVDYVPGFFQKSIVTPMSGTTQS